MVVPLDFRELFRRAAFAANDLARCSAQLKEMREKISSPSGVAYDSIHIKNGSLADGTDVIDAMIEKETALRERKARECEVLLDAAWEAVGVVSADLSDASAQVLSEHYLFGYTWQQVADSLGFTSRTTPKERAWAALDWLDSYCYITEDADGPHVHVIRD